MVDVTGLDGGGHDATRYLALVPRSCKRPIVVRLAALLAWAAVAAVGCGGGGDDAGPAASSAGPPAAATGSPTGPSTSSRPAAPEGSASTATVAGAAPAAGAETTVAPALTGPPDTAPAGPSGSSRPVADDGVPAALTLTVLGEFPHDPAAFTQGLVVSNGRLFESTGLVGASTVREVDLQTGAVLRATDTGSSYFGEGLAEVGDRLVQLTWRNGVALLFDRDTFARVGEFHYEGEGWGLCDDGARLVMSDGSPRLTFRDPQSFAVVGSVDVHDGGVPVDELNELECVGRRVFANVWHSDRIARIDPATGRVDGWLDAAALRPPEAGSEDVLNGIAYDEATDTYLLTGKRWPSIYRVRIG
jgi:glutamine cyclotransferase